MMSKTALFAGLLCISAQMVYAENDRFITNEDLEKYNNALEQRWTADNQ